MPEKFTPEIPPTETTEGGVAAPRLSRRKFLQAAGAATATQLLPERLEAETAKDIIVDSLPETIRLQSLNKKIDFTSPYKERTPEVDALIQEIGEFQHQVALTMGMEAGVNVAVDIPNLAQVPQQIAHLQKNLWQTLARHIPRLPPYSREQFYRTLTEDLPNYLARFGIYTETVSSVTYHKKTGKLNGAEVLVGFTTIRKADRTTITKDNKTIQRDVIALGDGLSHPGQKVFSLFRGHEPAEMVYQTIFIREHTIEDSWNQFIKAARFSTDNIRTREQFIQELSGTTGAQQRHVALNVAIVELRNILDRLDVTQESLRESIIAHETGHLWDAVNALQAQPPSESFTSAADFYSWSGNSSTNSEVSGFSQELRYSPQKYFILYQLIYNENPENQERSDFPHSKAIQWIMHTAIDILASDPTRYGFQVDRRSSVTVPNQMITQLPLLLLRRNDIEALADAVIAEHKRYSHIDFSEEYLKHRGIPRTTKPIIAHETLLKAAAGTALGSAALYGFKKLSERKRIGEARAMIETLFAENVERQQHFLSGLQLDASSKELNDSLRQKTLQELIHESRSRSEFKPVLAKLKLLMNEKNQKKLQKSLTRESGNQG